MVPVDHLNDMLPLALPWLQKAVEISINGYSLEHIVKGLHVGAFQLWAYGVSGDKGFVISEVIQHSTSMEVHLILAGGVGLKNWLPEIGHIESWAKQIGADYVLVWGRPGWKKLLQKHGYELETQVLRRSLHYKVQ